MSCWGPNPCGCRPSHRDDNCWRTHYWLFQATEYELRRAFKAMMLSGGKLHIFEALMKGEAVPVEELDSEWVARYGVRR